MTATPSLDYIAHMASLSTNLADTIRAMTAAERQAWLCSASDAQINRLAQAFAVEAGCGADWPLFAERLYAKRHDAQVAEPVLSDDAIVAAYDELAARAVTESAQAALAKAKQALLQGMSPTQQDAAWYVVPSAQPGHAPYDVELIGGKWRCSCRNERRGSRCYHAAAVAIVEMAWELVEAQALA